MWSIARSVAAGFCVLAIAPSVHAQWSLNGVKIFYNSGNVGIGTNNPSHKLDVRGGGARAISGLATASSGATVGIHGEANSPDGIGVRAIHNSNTGKAPALQAINHSRAASNDVSTGVAAVDGQIPSANAGKYSMAVRGIHKGNHAETAAVAGIHQGAGLGVYGFGPTGVMGHASTPGGYAGDFEGNLQVVGHVHIIQGANGGGRVGIKTGSPAFNLHVNGSAAKSGGGSWSSTSDRRLKRNIESLQGALEQLLALHGVTFEYLDPEAIHEPPGLRVGMIAQEVEQVFPDWVQVDGRGYLTVTYRGFEALTVEALRELRQEKDAQINAQQAELNALQAELQELRRTVKELLNRQSALEFR